jgi:oligopeptide/dipeptide ABC transporter ATP-binding protein
VPAAEAAAPVLAVDNLSIGFKGLPQDLVDGVSFEVGPGNTLCIVGESGCGKSLTALAIMGLLPVPPARPSGTAIRFEGRDLLAMDDDERARLRGDRMTMIFQEPMTSLNPAFTIGNQIAEVILRHRDVSREQARARAVEMLERVRIPAAAMRFDDYPHQMSGGMRQRVMIAMALANDPALLIADEPTTALDVTIQAQILQLMRTLQTETGTALILITHDLGVVAEIADEVAVMYAGRIVEAGSAEQVFDDPQHPYTIGLMNSIPSLGRRTGRLVTVPGSVPPPERLPSGCRFSTRCPFVISDCRDQAPPLRALEARHRVACIRAPIEDHVEVLTEPVS